MSALLAKAQGPRRSGVPGRAAKDKEAAARLFDTCDADRDRVITEQEARAGHMQSLKSQAIRLTTP